MGDWRQEEGRSHDSAFDITSGGGWAAGCIAPQDPGISIVHRGGLGSCSGSLVPMTATSAARGLGSTISLLLFQFREWQCLPAVSNQWTSFVSPYFAFKHFNHFYYQFSLFSIPRMFSTSFIDKLSDKRWKRTIYSCVIICMEIHYLQNDKGEREAPPRAGLWSLWRPVRDKVEVSTHCKALMFHLLRTDTLTSSTACDQCHYQYSDILFIHGSFDNWYYMIFCDVALSLPHQLTL